MPKTLLAIGAHLDDAFIGVGGVLLQAARAGCRVVIVTVVSDFSTRAQTRGSEQDTIGELMELSRHHGFEHHLLGGAYHQIALDDMELKRRIAQIVVDVQPDVGFIHHHDDHWPDHQASAKIGHDALLFTHGLTSDLTQRYCPLVYAFNLTPRQTQRFEPDVFYPVEDVLEDYMRLIQSVDACAHRQPASELIESAFDPIGDGRLVISLSAHARLRLADCIRFGDMAGCRYALGFRTVWGNRLGPALWPGTTSADAEDRKLS